MREKAKFEEEKRKKEEAALLKPVQTQKVPFGVDPKTVLCAFFKAGTCEKGNKCKFSHDLNVGRKVEKKNLYEDSREDKMKGAYTVRSARDRCSRGSEGPSRYDGELGRGKAPDGSPVEKRKPSDNYRRKYALVIACARKCSWFWIFSPARSFANTSSKRLRRRSTAGFGNVLMGKAVTTDMHFHRASSSNPRRRRLRTRKKQTRSVWKNSWKSRYGHRPFHPHTAESSHLIFLPLIAP